MRRILLKSKIHSAKVMLVIPALAAGTYVLKAAGTGDLESLKATHERYINAWSERDVETIVAIGTGSVGFGHSTAFPRPIRIKDEFENNVNQFYEMMEVFQVNLIKTEHLVVGNTGLVWGHYSQTTKQIDGPKHTIYLRFTHTFVKTESGWKLVLYHRSRIPSEETQ